MNDKAEYWLNLCDDNLLTAKWLLEGKRYLDMGFFCHQIVEKALKSIIVNKTEKAPPKIHDLKKLSKIGCINEDLSAEQHTLLERLEPLQIEARYPEYRVNVSEALNPAYCAEILMETEAFLCWIKKKSEK